MYVDEVPDERDYDERVRDVLVLRVDCILNWKKLKFLTSKNLKKP
jgi:hypothetical protein